MNIQIKRDLLINMISIHWLQLLTYDFIAKQIDINWELGYNLEFIIKECLTDEEIEDIYSDSKKWKY